MVLFTFFYSYVTFTQQNLAENLQKQGGFIPGIRPGKPTSDYITRVLFRITWAGAFFLGLIAVLPYFATTLKVRRPIGSPSRVAVTVTFHVPAIDSCPMP